MTPAERATDRSVAPRTSGDGALRLPHATRHTLSNGLDVLIVPKPGLPVVDVALVLRTGARDDPQGSEGLAAFVADTLEEGAAGRDGAGIADALDFLGARLEVDATWDATVLALHVLAPRLDAALALLADVVARPDFPADDVRRRRDELVAALLSEDDEPAVLASKAFAAAVYGDGHRYGRPLRGTRETASRLERDSLVAFQRARYRPGRGGAFAVVAGAIEPERLLASLERALGGWAGEAAVAAVPEPAAAGGAAVHVIDRPGAPQSEIRVGHPGPPRTTPDYFPLIVLNTVLGGSFTSRLNLRLREEKGYTYGARSAFAFRSGPGPFVESAAIFTAATADAVTDFLGEMRRIREEAVDEDELDRARRYLALGLPRRFETGEQIAAQLADAVLHGLGDDYYDGWAARVEAVTPADVRAAATRHLAPESAQIVIVGDAARIADELARLDAGPVRVYAAGTLPGAATGKGDA